MFMAGFSRVPDTENVPWYMCAPVIFNIFCKEAILLFNSMSFVAAVGY
jgi:hypothetical protein